VKASIPVAASLAFLGGFLLFSSACHSPATIPAAAIAPRQGQSLKIPNLVDLELVWIAPSTFTMGGVGPNHVSNEMPLTQVTFSKGYWLGKTEVTQAQWQEMMGSNPSTFFKGESLPVQTVSWTDAMEFCRKLTERERAAGRLPEGFSFSLPTEAQWEFACRAGTTGDYAGDLDAMAWYGGAHPAPATLLPTHPVGQKLPNAWGLFDMAGNVAEWCLDWYAENYSGGNVTDPTGPASGTYRVIRGGAMMDAPSYCRSASRLQDVPREHYLTLGFRIALTFTLEANGFAPASTGK
jgi:formylglycine-generating enzyme required for sulfatase activity